MEGDQQPFGWVRFPEGRARFSGGIRGWDEAGHDTFAVEIAGREWFGEIDNVFLDNGNDFNIEVVSFGYADRSSVGMPRPCLGSTTFDVGELKTIQSLILQLVKAGLEFEPRPFVLSEHPDSHFQGKVLFRDGWALESDGHRGSAR